MRTGTAENPEDQDEGTARAGEGNLPKAKSILVVDDEEVIRDFFQSALETEGYRVTTASNAAEARKALQKEDFEAVVLDIILPDMNGILLFHQIKKDHPRLADRVIFLSGVDIVKEFNQDISDLGAAFLTKPVDYEVLINTVNETVNGG